MAFSTCGPMASLPPSAEINIPSTSNARARTFNSSSAVRDKQRSSLGKSSPKYGCTLSPLDAVADASAESNISRTWRLAPLSRAKKTMSSKGLTYTPTSS